MTTHPATQNDESPASNVPGIVASLTATLVNKGFGSFASVSPGTSRTAVYSIGTLQASGFESLGHLKEALNEHLKGTHDFTVERLELVTARDLGVAKLILTK